MTYEPHHEEIKFLHIDTKTKAQISCAVTAQLINAFVLAKQIGFRLAAISDVENVYLHLKF